MEIKCGDEIEYYSVSTWQPATVVQVDMANATNDLPPKITYKQDKAIWTESKNWRHPSVKKLKLDEMNEKIDMNSGDELAIHHTLC
jgi:hypothetical protein